MIESSHGLFTCCIAHPCDSPPDDFCALGAPRAGSAGWIACLLIAWLAFGLTSQVLWVSQVKGLLLSVYVLAVIWPALFLYNVVNQVGGVQAIAKGLEEALCDRGILLIIMAWAFSGMLEGLAGFGIPHRHRRPDAG